MKTTIHDIPTRDGARLRVTIYESSSITATAATRDVLLVHGWPNAGRIWRALAEELLIAGDYCLIAPDLRGFGDSEKAAGGYTCAGFASDIEDVAAALRLSRYALVGHSMGGKIAQLVASRQPQELTGLALLAPSPLVVAAPTPEERKAQQRAAFGDAEQTKALVLGMASRPLSAEMQAILTDDARRAAPQAWNGWIDPMRDEDFTPEAARIAVPTLVVHGEKDRLRTEEGLRRDVAERITNAEFTVLPAVGHLPHLEDPTALALLLVNFLDALP